jgi:hypothetical protein
MSVYSRLGEFAMYQVIILDAIGDKAGPLRSTLEERVRDLNLDPARELEFLGPSDVGFLRTDAPRVGVLFSADTRGRSFAAQVRTLLDSPAVVIPAVTSLADFPSKVPDDLAPTNGMKLEAGDPKLEKVAALVLELLGLMRKRRRLFISYKRSESAAVAQQLHHALDERSFDVFLDTLSVRAADPFQEQLWHRMADADVVVLLYTTSIHSSGWVQQEIERANGMKITVLQVIWPGVKRDRSTELFEPLYLASGDFDPARPGELKAEKAEEICTLVEGLRAKSLANREAELVGTLRDRADKQQLATAVQPTRFVDVRCDTKRFTRVIPTVGVPDSEAFHRSALAPVEGAAPQGIVLLYDSLNVAPEWRKHLDWLHGFLPVKTLKASEVDQWLSGLCR